MAGRRTGVVGGIAQGVQGDGLARQVPVEGRVGRGLLHARGVAVARAGGIVTVRAAVLAGGTEHTVVTLNVRIAAVSRMQTCDRVHGDRRRVSVAVRAGDRGIRPRPR